MKGYLIADVECGPRQSKKETGNCSSHKFQKEMGMHQGRVGKMMSIEHDGGGNSCLIYVL